MTRLKPSLDQLARDTLDDIGLVPENGSAAGQSDDRAMCGEEPMAS